MSEGQGDAGTRGRGDGETGRRGDAATRGHGDAEKDATPPLPLGEAWTGQRAGPRGEGAVDAPPAPPHPPFGRPLPGGEAVTGPAGARPLPYDAPGGSSVAAGFSLRGPVEHPDLSPTDARTLKGAATERGQSPVASRQSSESGTQHSTLITHHFPGFDPGFLAALERLSIATMRPAQGQHAGAVRSRWRGRALEFADYRPYSPGDDPKLVDWRGYARLGRLFLKQYEEERTRTLTLLLDMSASLDWGEGEVNKGLYARRLAAALAWISINRQEPVRTFLLRGGTGQPLPQVANRSGTVGLFRQLGSVQEGGGTGLGAAVRGSLRGRFPGPAILLSDLLEPGWLDALEVLAATREGVVLQLLSPAEWEPPLGEEVELEDSETGELRPTRLGPIELADYRQRLDEFLSQVRHQCHRLGLIHLAINTGTPLQETVLRHLPNAGILR